MAVTITNDDYESDDWDAVYTAGAVFLGVIGDIAFHDLNPGEGWSPRVGFDDVAGLVDEAREHLERMEKAARAARAEIARVERVARLRAGRRESAERTARG